MNRSVLHKIGHALTDRGCTYRDSVFFLGQLEKYPWTAVAPKTIKPQSFPHNHVAVDLKSGRVWGFETMQVRDAFVASSGGSKFP